MLMDEVFWSTGSGMSDQTPPRQSHQALSWYSHHLDNREHLEVACGPSGGTSDYSATPIGGSSYPGPNTVERNDEPRGALREEHKHPTIHHRHSHFRSSPVVCESRSKTQQRNRRDDSGRVQTPDPTDRFNLTLSYSSGSESPPNKRRRNTPMSENTIRDDPGHGAYYPEEVKASQFCEGQGCNPHHRSSSALDFPYYSSTCPIPCSPVDSHYPTASHFPQPPPALPPFSPPYDQPLPVYHFGEASPERAPYYYSYPSSNNDQPLPVYHFGEASPERAPYYYSYPSSNTSGQSTFYPHNAAEDINSSSPGLPQRRGPSTLQQRSTSPEHRHHAPPMCQSENIVVKAVTFSPTTDGEETSDLPLSLPQPLLIHLLYNKPSKQAIFDAGTPRARAALTTWYERLSDLYHYKSVYGDCMVPQKYEENPSLGIWVNKQRMEKNKLQEEGEKSALSEEKMLALDEVGFVWAKRKGQHSWNIKYEQLYQYRSSNGDCLVPTKYAANPALGRWVSTQRSQYKNKYQHEATALTNEREAALTELGFVWRLLL